MHDRFGPDGFLAAYNAGPGRYEDYLKSGGPLPEETRNYVATLAPVIGMPGIPYHSAGASTASQLTIVYEFTLQTRCDRRWLRAVTRFLLDDQDTQASEIWDDHTVCLIASWSASFGVAIGH